MNLWKVAIWDDMDRNHFIISPGSTRREALQRALTVMQVGRQIISENEIGTITTQNGRTYRVTPYEPYKPMG